MSEQLDGELNDYAPYRHQAKEMNAIEFSEKYNAPIRFWGKPTTYLAVGVNGTDYLWKLSDGAFIYDGWDKPL